MGSREERLRMQHLANINCSKIGEGRATRLTDDQEKSLMIIAKTFSEFGFGLNKAEFMKLASTGISTSRYVSVYVHRESLPKMDD